MSIYEIEILRKRHPKGDSRKTMVLPSRRSEPFGRRRRQNIYINYWDLGQLADGSDIDWSWNATIDEIRLDPFSNSSLIAPEVVYDYNDYKDDLFDYFDGIGRDNWDSTFKQFDDTLLTEFQAQGLSLVVTGESDYVSGKGFVPDAASVSLNEITVQSSQRSFNTWATDDTVNYKITSDPDYSASTVPFTLNKSCDVFLLPQIQLWEGRNEYVNPSGADPHFNVRSQLLGLFLAPESREFTLFNSDWDDFKTTFDAYIASIGGTPWLIRDSFSTTYHSMWIDLFKNHPASRMKYFDFGSDASWYPLLLAEGDLTSDAPGNFLDGTNQGGAADFSPFGTLGLPTWLYGPWVGLRKWHRPEGLLLAVIRKGSDWFYVWQQVGQDVALYHSGNENITSPTSGGSIYGGVRWFYN